MSEFDVNDQLNKLSVLKKGWDGYNGSAIDPNVIDLVREIYPSIEGLYDKFYVVPCSDGSIQVEGLINDDYYMEISIFKVTKDASNV